MDTQYLRQKFAKEVAELSETHTWKFLLALATDWAVIASAIYFCKLWFNPLSYFIAATVIAGRQHALLILSHDGAHFRISSKSWLNDAISDCCAALPAFASTGIYRAHHSKHHRFVNTDQDPDWVRKLGRPQWTFPLSKSFVLKTYPLFVIFRGAVEWAILSLYFSGLLPLKTALSPTQRKHLLKQAAYFSVVAAILTVTSKWSDYLLFWVIPLFFVFPSFQRMRSVAEHFGLKYTHELNGTRNVIGRWYEAWCFYPHSVSYHLTHHLFPAVPFYNLKKLNAILMTDEQYRKLAHQNETYIAPSNYPMTWDLLSEYGPGRNATEDLKKTA